MKEAVAQLSAIDKSTGLSRITRSGPISAINPRLCAKEINRPYRRDQRTSSAVADDGIVA
jgi:hypothetical protein